MGDPVAEEEYARSVYLASARGHKQKARAATRADGPLGGGDPGCADGLLQKWAYGLASAEQTHLDASLAYKTGARGGALKSLADMTPGHCSAQIMDLVMRLVGSALVPVTYALVPMFLSKGTEDNLPRPELSVIGMLLPHVWFSFMFKYHRRRFFKVFAGTTANNAVARVQAFWNQVHPEDPRLSSGVASLANYTTRCFPIGWHGDGVPCTKKDSLNVLSQFGLLAVGKTLDTIMFLAGIYSKTEVTAMILLDHPAWSQGTTQTYVFRILVWSMLALESGRWPYTDWSDMPITAEPFASLAGQYLADGWFAHLWSFRCDAEYTYNHMGLPGHWSSSNPCHACQCDSNRASPMGSLNFSPGSLWPATVFVNMDMFYAFCELKGKSAHILLRPRADGGLGCHVLIFARDTLHCVDLGVGQNVLGSVLWLLCYGAYLGDALNPIQAMHQVFSEINLEYSRRRVKVVFTNITLDMFVDADRPRHGFPSLNGKAAETRHLVPILHTLWTRLWTRENDAARSDADRAYDKHVTETLRTLSDFIDIVDARNEPGVVPLFLTDVASQELRDITNRFMIHHTFLENLALNEELGIWHMTSKYHSMWHSAYESQYQHPAIGRTYVNEDYMGKVKDVGMSNRYAVPAHRRARTLTEKIPLGRSLNLWIEDRDV